MKRILKTSGYTLLVVIVLFNIIAAFHAWQFTHFYDENHVNKLPEQMSTGEKLRMVLFGVHIAKSTTRQYPDTPYEKVMLPSTNKLLIEGWWIPVMQAKGTVILFHGYNGNKGTLLPEASYFRSLGYNTFLVDFRAHGNSQGLTCSVGYKEAGDVLTAWNYVSQKAAGPIVLWGVSMGAAAIMKAIPEYHLTPQKIIIESPFATLTDAVKSRMRAVNLPPTPLSQILTFWGGLEQGFWGPGFKPAEYAHDIHMPVLYCYGAKDIRVEAHETEEIFSQLGTKDKQLHIFPNAGHQSFCQHDSATWHQLVRSFLQ
ncbi:alpha/beta hydrolase [Chitinophaga silvatica]|uniref:Alpha/beta hydrolase n=1 Tax=Chitinophaga silvatica TaxID=2282649 RepID=A0A3E1YAZ3_9BACT|nr:alpha/beta fold hydrolase [Chitinophaga silvatica]RFS23233.1 alpha/beta hydrolase [Chitinophaga silvatica]